MKRMGCDQHHCSPGGKLIRSGNSTQRAVFFIACSLMFFFAGAGQSQAPNAAPSTTNDHKAADGWWPTKSTASLEKFAGQGACGECHSQEASTQAHTPMAHAAFRSSDGQRSLRLPEGGFKSGDYSYRLISDDSGLRLAVSSGEQSTSAKVGWIFGAGVHGQTYILENGGVFYESQVSTFSSTGRMDITPGHTQAEEHSLQHALGERLTATDTTKCFGCHTTASSSSSKFDAASAQPGVHCEACHGPGVDHIGAVKNGQIDRARQAILNPAHLTPADSVDFCGACHRTSLDVVEARAYGAINIRFQPYRLEKSRCWGRTGDGRLTCVACHNPHEPLVKDASFYDRKCLACHSSNGISTHLPVEATRAPKVCPTATANCVSCHMPKYDAPGMHAKFTDHFIRIVRANELYPN